MTDPGPPSPPSFDPAGIVSAFNRHAVRYVVIGAFAAIAQQAPITPTRDIDFTPDPDPDNLARLSDALQELRARIRTDAVDGGLRFDHDAQSLARATVWNLICPYGEFDLCFRPAGFDGGYAQLSVRSRRVVVDNVEVTIADLDDVIRSKEAAGRPKDIRVLPTLYRFQASRRADGNPT